MKFFDESKLKIIPVEINEEMKKSYIDYSMSIIIGRALPDVRDGLKPVHRRILYAMNEDGIHADKAFKKSATTVGNVLGRYHPHGDAAIYDSLVRMAQNFSLRYPLINGHGNFGSIDGDAPAAYRYTEARMSKLSMEMLVDIEKNTVNYVPNYDDTRTEPSVLPSKFPNLLANGSSGIAVGMATNIPPHNISELIDGIIALIENPEITINELIEYIKAPDFPTGATIMGLEGIKNAYNTGRGKLIIRAKSAVENWKEKRQRIVFTEIPYMLSKSKLIEKMADVIRDKKIEGISDMRDESGKEGLRIVVELKRDVNSSVILNQLYKFTELENSFNVIMLALVDNEPKILNLKEILVNYLNFQKEILIRKLNFDKKKAENRKHLLEGIKIALEKIDEIIKIIKTSKTIITAEESLKLKYGLDNLQTKAIVEMRLGKLANLETEKIEKEYEELVGIIKKIEITLGNEEKILENIKEDLLKIKNKFGDERRTSIEPFDDEIFIEDLMEETDNVITITQFDYIKRMSTDVYKVQAKGGKGVTGIQTREEDFVKTMFVTTTHCHILFFTNKGKVYKLKAYQIPETGRQAKGMPIVNILQLEENEKISTVIPIRKYEEGKFLIIATKKGIIKKTNLIEFENINRNGKIGIVLDEDDELIKVKITNGKDEILIGTRTGLIIRFHEKDVRSMGRKARGVRSIKFHENDFAISMNNIVDNAKLLIVTENGFGKKVKLSDFKVQNRGGKGLRAYKISKNTGFVIGFKIVNDKDDIMLITSEGTIIRMNTENIRTIGRNTIGAKLMKFSKNTKLVGIAKLNSEKEKIEELH
ncbi:MAG: DNA gyrase subunit A [Clostridiales bacterium]|jgi:DNA gyrase subunit A|nr:DNA gyrase subunit A [Clostridiales bacterium]